MSIIYELLLKEEKTLTIRLKEVKEEIERYKTSSNTAIQYVASETSKPLHSDLIDGDIIKKYSTPQKVLYALKENNRFMRIREVAEYISGFTNEDVSNLVTQMSRRTKYLKEKNKIVKHQVGNKKSNTFWGSPKWLNDDGTIKKAHMYNDVDINKNQVKLIDL